MSPKWMPPCKHCAHRFDSLLGHFAHPAHAERDRPLILPCVLANEERHVAGFGEIKMRLEERRQPVARGSLRPVAAWREFLQPGAGRGEQKLAPGPDESRKSLDEPQRIRQAAKKVRGVNDVVVAEVSAQIHGVALLELHAVAA